MLLLYQLGRHFQRPPSAWILPKSNLSAVEAVFALDFDAACFRIGLDAEEQIRRSREDKRGTSRTITRKMGA